MQEGRGKAGEDGLRETVSGCFPGGFPSGSAQDPQRSRKLRYAGFLGAAMRPGTIRPPGTAGIGDGILIRPDLSFFAVGDGSDRNPRALRHVADRFTRMLASVPGFAPEKNHDEEDLAALLRRLSAASAALLRGLCPGDGCTLTGVLLLKTPGGRRGILFHTGDSLLYHGDAETGLTRLLSRSNFWLVGRTERFFQIEELNLTGSSRLLLATDGMAALFPEDRPRPEQVLGDFFRGEAVEDIPERLFARDDPAPGGRDDAAILCLDPARQSTAWPPALLGATAA